MGLIIWIWFLVAGLFESANFFVLPHVWAVWELEQPPKAKSWASPHTFFVWLSCCHGIIQKLQTMFFSLLKLYSHARVFCKMEAQKPTCLLVSRKHRAGQTSGILNTLGLCAEIPNKIGWAMSLTHLRKRAFNSERQAYYMNTKRSLIFEYPMSKNNLFS